jgi:DNA-binding MarR family transcriptional regulator
MSLNTAQHLHLDQQLCFRLYSVNKAMNRLYAPILKELDLTYPQYLVMLVLWEYKKPVNVKQIGQLLDLDSGTLSPLLKRMEKLSLITRNRNLEDERNVDITLTAHGKHIKLKAKHIPLQLFSLTGCSKEEFSQLSEKLDLLLEKLNK